MQQDEKKQNQRSDRPINCLLTRL